MSSSQGLFGEMKGKILSGGLPAGARLPSREEMLRAYGGSKSTIQKAMELLEREGFIVSDGRRGTFVAERPPHLYDVGLVLPCPQGRPLMPHHRLMLERQAEMSRICGKSLKVFSVDPERRGEDEFGDLADKAASLRMSGVIMPFHPQDWMLKPLLESKVPVVALTRERLLDGTLSVWLDYGDMICRALRHFKDSGRRRAGMLSNVRLPPEHVELFEREAGRAGLEVRRHWTQGVSLADSYSKPWISRQLAAIWASKPAPDALLVADESLASFAFATLAELGLVPGRDVQVVCHASLPSSSAFPHPSRRIGFDVRDIVAECAKAVGRRPSDPPPKRRQPLVKAKWEDGQ